MFVAVYSYYIMDYVDNL